MIAAITFAGVGANCIRSQIGGGRPRPTAAGSRRDTSARRRADGGLAGRNSMNSSGIESGRRILPDREGRGRLYPADLR